MSAVLKQPEIPVTDLVTISPETGKSAVVLTLVQRVNLALDSKATEKRLVKLVKQSIGIQSITNADGRAECHSAYMVLRNTRCEIKKTGKAARDDAQAFSTAVIQKENELVDIISPEEKRLLTLRDDYDEQCKREEEERIAKEAACMEAIESRIAAIRGFSVGCEIKSSKEIEALLALINAVDISEEAFEEFGDSATQAKTETKIAMEKLLMDAIEREDAEAERLAEIAAENARLAAAKAELDAANALFAEQKAEMQRQQEEMNRQREEMARQQETMRAELQRQQDALMPPVDTSAETKTTLNQIVEEAAATPLSLTDLLDAVLPDEVKSTTAPTAAEIILVIADCWGVSQDVARNWLTHTNFE
jgi:hypothetical protein